MYNRAPSFRPICFSPPVFVQSISSNPIRLGLDENRMTKTGWTKNGSTVRFWSGGSPPTRPCTRFRGRRCSTTGKGGGNPESFSFPEELFLVKEGGGTTLVALKLRATESHLMQRVVGTLSLPREGENPANGFANGLPSWEGKFCGGFRRLEEEPG